VVNVEYTDDTQIQVEQLEGDWLLTSLKAFTTEEKLTLTMSDGTVYNIKVTDEPSGNIASCYFAQRSSTTNVGNIDTSGNGVVTLSLYGKNGPDGTFGNYAYGNDDGCPTVGDTGVTTSFWKISRLSLMAKIITVPLRLEFSRPVKPIQVIMF